MAHALNPSTVVKRSDNQVFCVLDNEVALLNLDRAHYFGLNDTGAHIWQSLEKARSVADLCQDVFAHFDVTADVCRQDVLDFLASMRDAGLIEVVD
ncbi:MAG: PqqD family protein [Reyranellaceae bacterium]